MPIIDPMMVKTFVTLATSTGTGHLLVGAGLAVASAIANFKLKQAKRETTIFILDRLVYLGGGVILLDLLFKVLGAAYRLFSNF